MRILSSLPSQVHEREKEQRSSCQGKESKSTISSTGPKGMCFWIIQNWKKSRFLSDMIHTTWVMSTSRSKGTGNRLNAFQSITRSSKDVRNVNCRSQQKNYVNGTVVTRNNLPSPQPNSPASLPLWKHMKRSWTKGSVITRRERSLPGWKGHRDQ